MSLSCVKEKLTLAFDIEGTLLDKKGILQPEVYEIFKKADLSNTNFVFLTGGSYSIAVETVKQINDIIDGEFMPWIVSNGGSQIYAPSGNLIFDSSLDNDVITDAVKTAKEIDSGAVFMYATTDTNYVEVQQKTFNKIAMDLYKRKDAKKGCSAMNLVDVEGVATGRSLEDVLSEIGEVKELYAVSLSGSKREKLLSALENILAGRNSVYGGKYMAIPARNKLSALQYLVSSESSMPKDVTDVVYFGDGLNDVECLQACSVSIARGEQACKEAKEVAKFRVNDLSHFADALYAGEYKTLKSEEILTK